MFIGSVSKFTSIHKNKLIVYLFNVGAFMESIFFVEDHVVPQLFTTAIEAYDFEHRSSLRAKGLSQLETFGLLWGYSIPAKGSSPAKTIATMSTVETSALRHTEWVMPNFDSIKAKKAFFERYWPNIELVGTFHSHPYQNLSTVNDTMGWRASDGDEDFWPHFHEFVAPEQPRLSHLVVTIAQLQRSGWAFPDRLKNSEEYQGYVLSAGDKKLWLRAYASEMNIDVDEIPYFSFCDDSRLEIPALQKRFLS